MPRLLAVATVLCCTLLAPAVASAAPANDQFANATVLASNTSVTISGSNVDATSEAGENTCCWVYQSVWWKWTAPKTGNYRLEICGSGFNSHLKVLTGTAVNALEEVDENDDDPGCGTAGNRSRLTFIAFAGQEYKLQIGSQVSGQTGTISGSLALVSPSNDFFADTATLEGTSAPINGTNVDATNEAGESTCCWLYNSVWWKWTAPKTGNYRAEVCGSSFNSHLKVLTGTAVNALQEVAENDDDPGCGADGRRSRLTFIAGAGQEYRIQVGSQIQNQTGTIAGSLALVSPPNDFFADATDLGAGRTATISGTNVDASTEQGEPTCCFTSGTVWYRWTAPSAGSYRVETCGSSFTTYLKVLRGTAVTALERIAENSGAAGCGPAGDRAALNFTAGANTTYYIQIGSAAEPRGNITGSIAPTSTPTLPAATLPSATKGVSVNRKGRYLLITIKGTLLVPAGVAKASVCPARNKIRGSVRKGKKVLKSGRANLSRSCSYRKTLKVLRRKVGRARRLTVRVEYSGTAQVRRTVRSYRVKVR